MAQLTINRQTITLSTAQNDPLLRAVIISLFSWRRAAPDDVTEGARYGWWGDSYAEESGQLTGSRLWLLMREKLTQQTIDRAREYSEEALQWLVDDGVAAAVEVVAEAVDETLSLDVSIDKPDQSRVSVRFYDIWSNR